MGNQTIPVRMGTLLSSVLVPCKLRTEIDQTYSKFKMPKDRESQSKKRPKDDSSSDSDPDDRNPPPSKKDKSKDKSGPPMENGEPTWELGQNKKVKIREFKGKTYIDIREWYVDKKDMETKPGKKGISLNTIQFQQLRSLMEDVNKALP